MQLFSSFLTILYFVRYLNSTLSPSKLIFLDVAFNYANPKFGNSIIIIIF